MLVYVNYDNDANEKFIRAIYFTNFCYSPIEITQ